MLNPTTYNIAAILVYNGLSLSSSLFTAVDHGTRIMHAVHTNPTPGPYHYAHPS